MHRIHEFAPLQPPWELRRRAEISHALGLSPRVEIVPKRFRGNADDHKAFARDHEARGAQEQRSQGEMIRERRSKEVAGNVVDGVSREQGELHIEWEGTFEPEHLTDHSNSLR